MYIEKIPNRTSPPAILLRESYREDGKVKKKTIANLSKLPENMLALIKEDLKASRKNGSKSSQLNLKVNDLEITDSLSHGHVVALLATIRKLGLDKLIDSRKSKNRSIVLALIIDRIANSGSKLSTARSCNSETKTSTLADILDLEDLTDTECYEAMDWLFDKQKGIQKRLSKKHLDINDLVYFDLSSSYFEGSLCPLAKHGYSRDHRGDKPQVSYGVLANKEGCPVAIEVFEGNTKDQMAFPIAVKRARDDFGMQKITFVGDRGMISGKGIKEHLLDSKNLHWITALNSSSIKKLIKNNEINDELFDEENSLAAIYNKDYPGERLVVCRNLSLAKKRKYDRDSLLEKTTNELNKIKKKIASKNCKLNTSAEIGIAVGEIINKFKMKKHIKLNIKEGVFEFEINQEKVKEEESLDGIYIVRTDLKKETLNDQEVVASYKRLANVERTYKSFKSKNIEIRPIRHWKENRVKCHIFICMLSYYIEYHMRKDLAPILFHDEDIEDRTKNKKAIVEKSKRSEAAKQKDSKKINEENYSLSNFEDIINLLSQIGRHKVNIEFKQDKSLSFYKITKPNKLQKKALDLLGVKMYPVQNN